MSETGSNNKETLHDGHTQGVFHHDHYVLETTIRIHEGDFGVKEAELPDRTHGSKHHHGHHLNYIWTQSRINKISEMHVLKSHTKPHLEMDKHFQYELKLEIHAEESIDKSAPKHTKLPPPPSTAKPAPSSKADSSAVPPARVTREKLGSRSVFLAHFVFKDAVSLLAHLKNFELHSPDIIASPHGKDTYMLPVKIYCSHVYEKRHNDKLYMNFCIGIKSRDQNIHVVDRPVLHHPHKDKHSHKGVATTTAKTSQPGTGKPGKRKRNKRQQAQTEEVLPRSGSNASIASTTSAASSKSDVSGVSGVSNGSSASRVLKTVPALIPQ